VISILTRLNIEKVLGIFVST